MKDPRKLKISDYSYELPDDRIARYPLGERDSSKLLVYKDHAVTDGAFKDLPAFLPPDSLLVFNESKVIPARLIFRNDKGQNIELFCLEPANAEHADGLLTRKEVLWNCLTGGLKKWKPDVVLKKPSSGIELSARLIRNENSHQQILFSWEPAGLTFAEVLDKTGELPIPPYLNRDTESIDLLRYQTVYSRTRGSVAAPTAGLHFTGQVLSDLKKKGIQSAHLVLHVGAGTFKPVKAETMAGHEMHHEWMEITADLLDQVIAHIHKNVIAVGTTSLRALESLYWLGLQVSLDPSMEATLLEVKQWDPYEQSAGLGAKESLQILRDYMVSKKLDRLVLRTSILIAPPYELKICAGLLTNFHQPHSTLLLLVSAVVGEKWKEIYRYALDNNYRFLSYGDSSLLLK